MCRCCFFSLGILTCGSGPLRCMAVIFRKKKKKKKISYQFRLVNAMHRNDHFALLIGFSQTVILDFFSRTTACNEVSINSLTLIGGRAAHRTVLRLRPYNLRPYFYKISRYPYRKVIFKKPDGTVWVKNGFTAVYTVFCADIAK